MNGLLKYVIIGLIFLYSITYLGNELGYTEYINYKKSNSVQDKITEFEEKLAAGEDINLEDYFADTNVNYHNQVSKAGLLASETIENTFQETLKFIFERLYNSLNE